MCNVAAKIVTRQWQPEDLIDDLQDIIDEESDNYLNTRRTTLCMARDYLKEHFAEPKWISVKDRLPKVGEDVLVITSSSDRNMAVWRLFGNAENRQAHWEDEVGDGLVLGAATHWMPLPQPQKGE